MTRLLMARLVDLLFASYHCVQRLPIFQFCPGMTDMLMRCVPGDRPCPCNSGYLVPVLATRIAANRLWLDASLAKPALWRGQMRREALGYGTRQERDRYITVFNWMARHAFREPEAEP